MTVKKLMFILMLVATMLFVLVGCDGIGEESEYTLTIDVEGEGGTLISPEEGKNTYENGVTVDITVEVDEGYELNWEGPNGGDVAGPEDDGTYRIKMDGNKEITAKFIEVNEFDIADVNYWSADDDDQVILVDVEDGEDVIKIEDKQIFSWVQYSFPDGPVDLSIFDKVIVEVKTTADVYMMIAVDSAEAAWYEGGHEEAKNISANSWDTVEFDIANIDTNLMEDVNSLVFQINDNTADVFISSIIGVY